ncbi:MAG TPA: hypothetical protein VFZ44_03195 [Pyrinomonadaceae bacterium]
MKVLSKDVVASVGLVEAKISEDELGVWESALSYILDTLGDAEIEQIFGATRDELDGMRDDLREILGTEKDPEPMAEMSEKS